MSEPSIRDELVAICRQAAAHLWDGKDAAIGQRARDLIVRIDAEDNAMYEAVRRSAEYFRKHENEPNEAKE